MKTKPTILWLSDSPTTTTGYATVTRNILNRLNSDFDCHCIAHNYYGQTIKPPIRFEDDSEINFTLHGAGKAKYSMDIIQHKIQETNADLFGILLDTFMAFEAGFMDLVTAPAKTFFYYPSDGGGILPINCDHVLRKINTPIAMAKFGRNQVKKVHDINAEYIPHGYDSKVFYKESEEKRNEWRMNWLLKDKFVVGTVARNQGRKMLDRTLKAFKLFCQDKPDVVLLMHCDPNDGAAVFSLTELINRYKLNNRIIFTGTTFFNPFSYTRMREIYNLMDVFLLTTSGEGFGIPTIEAMACGVPQVVTDYTTSKELIIDDIQTGELVKLSGEDDYCPYPHSDEIIDGTITGSWNVERGIMSIYDCKKVLDKLYYDRALLKKYSDNSLIKAPKYYDWDVTIKDWKRVLGGMLK